MQFEYKKRKGYKMMKHYTIFVMAALLGAGLIACSGQAKEEAEKYREGWTLVWEDNMEQEGSDATEWSRVPKGKLPRDRYMSTNDALYIYQEGNLVLRGVENIGNNGDMPFLTGGISREGINKNSVQRIEVRARMSPVPGAVSYITLIPTDAPSNVSIDLAKRYGVDEFVYQSITSEYTTTGKMPDNPPSNALVGVNPNQYHVYGVEKYPDSLVFFVDGTRAKKYPRILTDIPGQFPFNDLDFNLQIGVQINKDALPENLPVDLFIDWVRIYEPAATAPQE